MIRPDPHAAAFTKLTKGHSADIRKRRRILLTVVVSPNVITLSKQAFDRIYMHHGQSARGAGPKDPIPSVWEELGLSGRTTVAHRQRIPTREPS